MMSSASEVVASSTIKTITAQLDTTIKLKLDGDDANLKNADGSTMYPILYNGRTYVQLGVVADLFGKVAI